MNQADEQPSAWNCKSCVDQMFSGVRCTTHNPTPEMRLERGIPYVRQHVPPPHIKKPRKRK